MYTAKLFIIWVLEPDWGWAFNTVKLEGAWNNTSNLLVIMLF
ncbi:hypothetical protein PSBY109024_16330 [Pseudoalteromonas byunsanensis]